MWEQGYDPMHNAVLSTAIAAVPIVVLLGALGVVRIRAHLAAALGLLAAVLIAILAFGMPAEMAGRAALYGVGFGLLPIGWIILNIMFLYQLTLKSGQFQILQDTIGAITADRRLQLLLIAFCFGAFFEGAAGGGTPVAVTGAILIGLGFSPLAASTLSLIANTAPVAYGGLGTPIFALAGVTGLDLYALSGMVGRQLPFFSLMVPFWLVWAFAGFTGMLGVWPAVLVGGGTFALTQFLVSNYNGPLLVDVVSALASIGALTLFLRIWRPAQIWHTTKDPTGSTEARPPRQSSTTAPRRGGHGRHGSSLPCSSSSGDCRRSKTCSTRSQQCGSPCQVCTILLPVSRRWLQSQLRRRPSTSSTGCRHRGRACSWPPWSPA